jgi:hypothetical protein
VKFDDDVDIDAIPSDPNVPRLNIRAMYAYCEKMGIDSFDDLTAEEKMQFLVIQYEKDINKNMKGMSDMGQYLQGGICYEIVINREDLLKCNLNNDELDHVLCKEVELSLFNKYDTESEIRYLINEQMILQQLYGFMRSLLAIYSEDDAYLVGDIESALAMIEQRTSLKEMIALANEKKYAFFQNNTIVRHVKLNHWDYLRIEMKMIVMILEGKIYMEGYNEFLRFIEALVKRTSKEWEIGGAFRVFIH